MTERGQQIRSGANKQGWEDAEFPILCETCLGDNPYIRMMKEQFAAECKICQRPYTVFKWKAGTKGRFKRTVICQTCAKLKNVCQTCILDLQFGLPVEVRDKFLTENVQMPTQIASREYYINQINRDVDTVALPYHSLAENPILQQLVSKEPNYKRNLPKVCSFWQKGECARGEECPYTHAELYPKEGPLTKQNYKDRFHGTKDPVAEKILGRLAEKQSQDTSDPKDLSIKSIAIRNISEEITEVDLREHFAKYGEIESLKHLKTKNLAYINYKSRDSAKKAVEQNYGKLIMKGAKLAVAWSKTGPLSGRDFQANSKRFEGAGGAQQAIIHPGSIQPPKGAPPSITEEQAAQQSSTAKLLLQKILDQGRNKPAPLIDYSDDEDQAQVEKKDEVVDKSLQEQAQ